MTAGAIFFQRVPRQPAAEAGGVVAVAVVEGIGFGVVVFGGEAEGRRMGGGRNEKFAEGGIVVMGENGAGRGDVLGDVAVGGIASCSVLGWFVRMFHAFDCTRFRLGGKPFFYDEEQRRTKRPAQKRIREGKRKRFYGSITQKTKCLGFLVSTSIYA